MVSFRSLFIAAAFATLASAIPLGTDTEPADIADRSGRGLITRSQLQVRKLFNGIFGGGPDASVSIEVPNPPELIPGSGYYGNGTLNGKVISPDGSYLDGNIIKYCKLDSTRRRGLREYGSPGDVLKSCHDKIAPVVVKIGPC
jgi:hypothetical protein